MKMSKDEDLILRKICKQEGINPKILKNIYLTKSDFYYSNESKNKVVVQEIIKEVRYWTKIGEN